MKLVNIDRAVGFIFSAVDLPGMHKITTRRKELLAVKMKGGLNPVRKTSTLFDENNGGNFHPLISSSAMKADISLSTTSISMAGFPVKTVRRKKILFLSPWHFDKQDGFEF